jgi:hypothetical protein
MLGEMIEKRNEKQKSDLYEKPMHTSSFQKSHNRKCDYTP